LIHSDFWTVPSSNINMASETSSVVGLSDEQKSQPGFPKGTCQSCGYRLAPEDKHRKCYVCLGGLHNIDACGHCQQLSRAAIYRRRRAQDTFLQSGTWPSSLELAGKKESSSTGSFQTAKTKRSKAPEGTQEDPQRTTDQETSPWDEAPAQQGEVVTIQLDEEAEEVEEEVVEDPPESTPEGDRLDFEAFMAARAQALTLLPQGSLQPGREHETHLLMMLLCPQNSLGSI